MFTTKARYLLDRAIQEPFNLPGRPLRICLIAIFLAIPCSANYEMHYVAGGKGIRRAPRHSSAYVHRKTDTGGVVVPHGLMKRSPLSPVGCRVEYLFVRCSRSKVE
jgi:hypothetical protein